MKGNRWRGINAWFWYGLYVLKSLAYLLWPTPKRVKRYFAHGLRTRWEWIQVHDWREMPNDWIISATITAQGNDGEMFYRVASIAGQTLAEILRSSGALERMMDIQARKLSDAMATLDKFLDPACRCKHGPHWRCPINLTWNS